MSSASTVNLCMQSQRQHSENGVNESDRSSSRNNAAEQLINIPTTTKSTAEAVVPSTAVEEISEKIHKLYDACDRDQKGFVVPADLQNLNGLTNFCGISITFDEILYCFRQRDKYGINLVRRDDFLESLKNFILENFDIERMEKRKQFISQYEQSKINGTFSTISLSLETNEPPDPGPKENGVPIINDKNSAQLNSPSKSIPVNLSTPTSPVTETTINVKKKVPKNGYLVNNEHKIRDKTQEETVVPVEKNAPENYFNGETSSTKSSNRSPSQSSSHQRRRYLSGCQSSIASDPKIDAVSRTHSGEKTLGYRLFKVVFVGDSAVGKTCFLYRYCQDRFTSVFNATIGVDFTNQPVEFEPGRTIQMQLWDTAGQERFRSITKQYFRKADGVVLMYDVTSEESFVNVRAWVESVRNGVDDGCVLCLIGNKIDLFPNDEHRTVTYKHGEDLAKEFDMLFFETSAFTGRGVKEAMKILAQRLKKREEELFEEAMRLEMLHKKSMRKWCCF